MFKTPFVASFLLNISFLSLSSFPLPPYLFLLISSSLSSLITKTSKRSPNVRNIPKLAIRIIHDVPMKTTASSAGCRVIWDPTNQRVFLKPVDGGKTRLFDFFSLLFRLWFMDSWFFYPCRKIFFASRPMSWREFEFSTVNLWVSRDF